MGKVCGLICVLCEVNRFVYIYTVIKKTWVEIFFMKNLEEEGNGF